MVLNFQIIRQALLVLILGSCEIYCEIEISSDSWVGYTFPPPNQTLGEGWGKQIRGCALQFSVIT